MSWLQHVVERHHSAPTVAGESQTKKSKKQLLRTKNVRLEKNVAASSREDHAEYKETDCQWSIVSQVERKDRTQFSSVNESL
jgi:hypothetical protein